MGNTMKLWILWAATYVLCTIMALIPTTNSYFGLALMLLGMAFFIPPTLLIRYIVSKKRTSPLLKVRNVAILSLALTLLMIILNLATYNAPSALQVICTWLLALVSTPLGCLPDQIWFLSLFGWACVLMAALHYLKDPATGKSRRRHRSSRSSRR